VHETGGETRENLCTKGKSPEGKRRRRGLFNKCPVKERIRTEIIVWKEEQKRSEKKRGKAAPGRGDRRGVKWSQTSPFGFVEKKRKHEDLKKSLCKKE